MKVKIIKKEKNELKIELDGEDHTLSNLLQSTLLEDNNVEIAGYDLPHPLSKKPIIFIKMKSGNKPEKSLEKALTKISKRTDEFLRQFSKAVEK
jgi:DNA-directed RNA polymerase subunit L